MVSRPEAQLSTCVDIAYRERGRQQQPSPRSGDITQNVDLGYACFQEKYYWVFNLLATWRGMIEATA